MHGACVRDEPCLPKIVLGVGIIMDLQLKVNKSYIYIYEFLVRFGYEELPID